MITKEILYEVFADQLKCDPMSSTSEYKDKSCYGNCPDFKVGDRLLFFILVTADYDEKSIKNSKDSGNLLTMHDKIRKTKTIDTVEKVTDSYIDDPDCELLNFTLTKVADYPGCLKLPVFTVLNRLDR